MSEETRVCIVCGRKFTWDYGEQRWYHEHGLEPPKRCHECRPTRRAAPEYAGYRPSRSTSAGSVSADQQWAEALRRAQPPAAPPPGTTRPAPRPTRPAPRPTPPAPGWNWPAIRAWLVFGVLLLLVLVLLLVLARGS
jgi:putative zinc ribbon protein